MLVERRLRDVFYRMLQRESLDAAIEFYREQREKSPRDYLYFPWPLRILTGQLMNDGRYNDAVTVLELNLETNPQDAKSIEMPEEARLRSGQGQKLKIAP